MTDQTPAGDSKGCQPPAVYRPRNPKASGWYRCVEDFFDEFVRVYDELFAKRFGFWRAHIEKVIHRFLDCGDLHKGFARVKCGSCGHEFLTAYSCKGRHFCPSCHQKRVVEFGEFLCTSVLAKVPHRHIVFSLPKIIRRNFLYDRKLLGKMSRCGWECLEFFLKASCPGDSMPGAVVAIQTFGDFLSFHPHLHILISDGCFQGENEFTRAPAFDWEKLEELFKRKIFRLLLNEGRITKELVEKLGTWRHSGFHVFCGDPIEVGNETSMENLARYIIRASLSQERMTYVEDEGKVIYQAKDGSEKKEFTGLEWLANICSHIPNPREHMVRYYGQYSNAARGKRKKQEAADLPAPKINEPLASKKEFRRNWARLIQKVYEVAPLLCPKCGGAMRVIAFIEDQSVIEKILKHLGLWLVNSRAPPRRTDSRGYEGEAIEQPRPDDFFPDPDHSWDDYL
jgi:hypothetical protein